jgi:hypothetical protein
MPLAGGVPGRVRRYGARWRLPVKIRAGDGHVTAAAGDAPVNAGRLLVHGQVSNLPSPGAVMTVYQGTSFTPELTPPGYALFRAGVKVSAGTCEDLAGSLRRRHEREGTRWRLLDPLAQAV